MNALQNLAPETQFWGGSAVLFCILLLLGRRGRLTSRGSAGWLTLWRAAWAYSGSIKGGLGLFRALDLKGNPGFLIGDWRGLSIGRLCIPCLFPVFYRGPSNILTIGSPGAAKTAGVLIPNALRHPFQVIYDIGGEISSVCISAWRRKGWKVLILNPWGLHLNPPYGFSMASLNPCDSLDPRSPSFSSDTYAMATELMGEAPQGDNKFFYDKALSGYDALIRLVTTEPKKLRNLVTVRQYIQGSDEDWNALIKRMTESRDEVVRAVGYEWKKGRETNSKTHGLIIGDMEKATKWLDDEPIRSSISRSTIRLKDLKGYDENGKKLKGAILSIVIHPRYQTSHAVYIRLMLASVLREMMSEPIARSKVPITIDEFPSLKKFPLILDALGQNRKYRFFINIVAQSIAQLKDIYGPHGWNWIAECCAVRQILSAWGLDTAEWVSQMCGNTTTVEKITLNIIQRPLIFADEVLRMPTEQQIVFINNLPAARLRIRPYWERLKMRAVVNDNPFHGGTPRLNDAKMIVQAVSGLILRVLSGVVGPLALVAGAVAAWIL